MGDFSRALSKLQVIAGNFEWFIVLFARVVIAWGNYFGSGFLTFIWKPLNSFLSYIAGDQEVQSLI